MAAPRPFCGLMSREVNEPGVVAVTRMVVQSWLIYLHWLNPLVARRSPIDE